MITVEATLSIDRAAEDVFAYVADPANEPAWHLEVTEAEVTSPAPLGRRSEFRWLLTLTTGALVETAVRVCGFEPARLLELHAEGGGVRQAITWVFEHDNGTTRCTRSVALEAGVSPNQERNMRPLLEAHNQLSLERLKAVLEAKAGPEARDVVQGSDVSALLTKATTAMASSPQ